jgi:2,3-diphosphopglycerate-independent phosphoglycerate mutase
MNLDDFYSKLTIKTKAKLVLLVLDGLGDLATKEQGFLTPLEAATTPNLDALAKLGAQGRMIPVAPGITPGSGPGHLGLFGYDPIEYQVGRGVIEALGLGVELRAGDIAARANFCTLDAKGIVTDRRAGRIATEVTEELCALAREKSQKGGRRRNHHQARQRPPFRRHLSRQGLGRPADRRRPKSRRLAHSNRRPDRSKLCQAKKTAKLIAEFYKPGPAHHRAQKAGQRIPHARHRPSTGTSPPWRSDTDCARPAWPSIPCTRGWRNWSA